MIASICLYNKTDLQVMLWRVSVLNGEKMMFLRLVFCLSICCALHAENHLFILSGQSNMARLDPAVSFTPAVEAALGKDRVTVVKDAQGGKPIRMWYKKWQPQDKTVGTLYDRLLGAVKKATNNKRYDSVTFVWMQGERDAKEQLADKYVEAFKGLVQQLETDLQYKNINVVIGRLSDFDMGNKKYKHWTQIREIQEQLAQSKVNWTIVDTDDYNGKINDLHHTKEGYVKLGAAFAQAALQLVKVKKK